MTAANALARDCEPGDERTADQRGADALVDPAIAALHDLDDQPGELAGHGPYRRRWRGGWPPTSPAPGGGW